MIAMGRRSRWFSPVAYYVTKRARSEWIDFSDEDLLTMLDELPRKRLRLRFGRIPRARRRSNTGQDELSRRRVEELDETKG